MLIAQGVFLHAEKNSSSQETVNRLIKSYTEQVKNRFHVVVESNAPTTESQRYKVCWLGSLDFYRGHPARKNREKNSFFCFLISFYGHLKGYLCELTLFDLFGSVAENSNDRKLGFHRIQTVILTLRK